MMNDGLVDERIAREVLKGLKELAVGSRNCSNSDLKAQRGQVI